MQKPPVVTITKEQAIGYLIATLEANYNFWDAMDKAALVLDLEKQFLNLQPKEAEQIYAERWASWEQTGDNRGDDGA